ncbi:hypothetical protein ACPCK7_34340, partial [Streptomyces pseudogriseolus]
MQNRECGDQGVRLGPVPALYGHADRVGGVVEGGAGEGGEGGVGAEFDEAGDAFRGEGGDAVGETDGLADVADPVVGGGQLATVGGEAAGDV